MSENSAHLSAPAGEIALSMLARYGGACLLDRPLPRGVGARRIGPITLPGRRRSISADVWPIGAKFSASADVPLTVKARGGLEVRLVSTLGVYAMVEMLDPQLS